MKIPINKIIITRDNPRQEFNIEKIRQIGESILRHGQIHPIIIRSLPDGFFELVTGELRVRGCKAVGLEEIEADIKEITDIECKILRLIENVHREDLTDAEKGDAVIELAEVEGKPYKDIAEAELSIPEQTVRKWVSKSNRISEKLRQCSACGTLVQRIIDPLLKYSHNIQDRLATFIIEWNKDNPTNEINSTNIREFCKEHDKDPNIKLEDIAKKVTGFVPVTVWQPKTESKPKPESKPKSKSKKTKQSLPSLERCIALTRKGKRCNSKRLPNSDYCSRHVYVKRGSKPKPEKKPEFKLDKKLELPEGKFDVIYADPPWKYDFTMTERGDPEVQYPTMELEEIKNYLTKNEIHSADNTVLFLWATAPKLADGTILEVIKAWGFEGKTILVWDKEIIGTGYYVRSQTEFLIIATKGKISPPEPSDRPSSLLHSRRREHSRKPDEIYEIIEKMYPNRKYLELFARNKRDNWVSWGLEV